MTADRARLEAIKERASRPRSMDYIYIASKYDDDVPWLVERLEEAVRLLRLVDTSFSISFLSRFEEQK